MTYINCKDCKYYFGDLSCLAFERIPQDILEGAEHNEVRPFQEVDVIFEEKKEGEEPFDFEPELA